MSIMKPQRSLLSRLELSPEEKVLLLCARRELNQQLYEELETLVGGTVNWDQLLYKARWHGLAPLAFQHLSRLERPEKIPDEIMGRLKSAYLGNVAQNMSFQTELWQVVSLLHKSGIPVILLKGSAMIQTVYQDIGLRQLSDLDLLVPEEKIYQAQDLIIASGYRPKGNLAAQGDTAEKHRHLPGLVKDNPPILIEIHRHIVRLDSAMHFDISGFWNRARDITTGQGQALVLAPEDLLIHLAINFLLDRRYHSRGALRQLSDISESIGYYQGSIDWQLLASNLHLYRLTKPVACSLYLAQQLLGAEVPDHLLQPVVSDSRNHLHMESLTRRRVLGEEWVAKELNPQQSSPYQWWATPWVILRRVFPNQEYLAKHYGIPVKSKRLYYFYLMRLVQTISIAARCVIRPREIREDIAVDRWLHSTYASRTDND